MLLKRVFALWTPLYLPPSSYHTIMYACPYDPLLQLLPTFHSVANWSKYFRFRSRIWLCKGSHPSSFCLIYLALLAATYIMTPTYITILIYQTVSVRVFLNKYKKYSKLFEYMRVQVHDTYYYLPTLSSFSKQHSHLLATYNVKKLHRCVWASFWTSKRQCK